MRCADGCLISSRLKYTRAAQRCRVLRGEFFCSTSFCFARQDGQQAVRHQGITHCATIHGRLLMMFQDGAGLDVPMAADQAPLGLDALDKRLVC